MNTYAIVIKNGLNKDNMNHSVSFLIFAETKDSVDNFIEKYVKDEKANDRYKNDDGEIVNHWWKEYEIKYVPIEDFDNECANIRFV